MNKKLQNFVIVLAIISGISFFYAIGHQYIFKLAASSRNDILLYLISACSSFGKVSLELAFIQNGNFEIYDSQLLKTLMASLFTIIISMAVLIGCMQFIATKGRVGKKRIKFALVLISLNCITSICFIIFRLYSLLAMRNSELDWRQMIFTLLFLVVSILFLVFTLYFKNALKKMEQNVAGKLDFSDSSIFTAEQDVPQYEQTKAGYRFLNVLIDRFLLIIISSNLAIYTAQTSSISSGRSYRNSNFEDSIGIFYLMFIVMIIFYYTFFEKVFGYTAGKALTNSKVINNNGNAISIGQAFGRTFSRFVPFEWISAFMGSMWHDNWTNTFVVDNHNVQTNAEVSDVSVLYQ